VPGLASSPFAHHYSGNRGCFLFLRVLRCFTSPRYHQPPYAFRRRRPPMTGARFPHSETPGSQPGCRLPGAYRRLQRPSSAPGAKASTVCPKKLGTTQLHSAAPPKEGGTVSASQKQEMLASTVQFSRNGRQPEPGPPIQGNREPGPLTEDPGSAPVPSGPNSVPTQNPPRPPVPHPAQPGRTSQEKKQDLGE
jgi:hypothetical protein